MNALKKKKSLILDTCEIFVKEPLLDWVKDARKRNNQLSIGGDQLTWNYRMKIQIVREKLLGRNPVNILQQELDDSYHSQKKYYPTLKKVIRGNKESAREKLRSDKNFLDVED